MGVEPDATKKSGTILCQRKLLSIARKMIRETHLYL